MNEKEVLEGIQSTSPKMVLNSLISLADFLDHDAINSQFLNTSFHLLIPLISSNHFKIRSNSLIILSDILDNWYDSITDSYLALPGSLLALLSVNKIVSKCGISCLKQILQNENPIVYWPDIEKTITSSRSLEVRIQVLEMLTAVSDKIPLIPIVKLVDDPKYQIRRAALELLQTVDTQKLKEAARSVKISYEAMKLLFSTCPELGDIDSLDPNYNKEQFSSKSLSIRSKSRLKQDDDSNNQQPVILQSSKLLRNNTSQNSKPLFTSTRQYKSRIPTANSRNKSQQNDTEKSLNSTQTRANARSDSENAQRNRNFNKSKLSATTKQTNRYNNNTNRYNNNSTYRNEADYGDIGIVVRNSRDDLINKVRTLPQNESNFNENSTQQIHNEKQKSDMLHLKNEFFIEEEEEEIEVELTIQTIESKEELSPQSKATETSQIKDNSNKKLKITTQSSPNVFEKASPQSSVQNSPAIQSDNEYDSNDLNSNQKKKKKKIIKQKSANNSNKKPKSPHSNNEEQDDNQQNSQTSSILSPTANQTNHSKIKQSPNESSSKISTKSKQNKSPTSNYNKEEDRSKQSPTQNTDFNYDENENSSRISTKNKLKQSPINNDSRIKQNQDQDEFFDLENENENSSRISAKSRSKQSPTSNYNNEDNMNSSRISAKSKSKQSPTSNYNNEDNMNSSRISAKSKSKQSPTQNANEFFDDENQNENNSRIITKNKPRQSPSPNNEMSSSRISTKDRNKQSQSPNNEDTNTQSNRPQNNFNNFNNYNYNENFYEEETINENFASSSNNLLQKKMNHNQRREEGAARLVSFTEPIGHLEMAPKISIDYRPQDLAETTWLEKITFLDSMGAALATNQQFTDSPLDLLDCVLITAYPPHQKVTFMIPPILSELILRYPEIVRKRLTELVTFSLFTMVGDEWQDDSGFDKFLSVFILESDATDLIETALKVTDETERKLPFELLIMCVYEEIPDMQLPYSVVAHLVCNILKRFPLNEAQEELFTFICERELEFVRKYGMKLPLDARHKIVSFIRKSEKFNASEINSVTSRQSQQKQQKQQVVINIPSNESAIMKIVNNEFKIGPKKSNLQRCLLALTAMESEFSMDLFVNFLNYLGKFTEIVIYENEEELSKLCMKQFTSNKYLKFLDASYVLPETIVGFSKIVWCSPQSLLQGADEYLLSLYEIFKNSNGKVRIDIIKIVIAINKVTGASILDFEEVVEPYRKLISSLISQFHYQK